MWEVLAKTPFSAKMTGHKMLIATGHFVVGVNGMGQHIPIEFLANGHPGVTKIKWARSTQNSACGLNKIKIFLNNRYYLGLIIKII